MVDHTRHTARGHLLFRLYERFAPSRRVVSQPVGGAGPRKHLVRACLLSLATVLALGTLGLIGAGLLLFRLSQGPISIDNFRSRIEAELDTRIGHGYDFRFGEAAIERGRNGPSLAFAGLILKDASGQTIVAAPRAEVSIDLLWLLIGQIKPTRLELFDLEVRLSILGDGTVSVSAGTEPVVLSAPGRTAPETQAPGDGQIAAPSNSRLAAMRPMADALRAMLDMAVGTDSPIGSLRRVGISRGKLAFEDQITGQATSFNSLEFVFEKRRSTAHLSLSADGPNRRWQVEAGTTGAAGAERALDVEVRDVSLDEIALVGGMRDPGFDFDMPISVKMRFGLAQNGDLAASAGSFHLGSGYFFLKDPDHEPLRVDDVSGGFRWDEASQRIILDPTTWRSGASHISVSGSATPPHNPGEPWLLEASSGPGSEFGAERPGEGVLPIQRATLSGRFLPANRRFVLDRFEALGPDVSIAATADYQWGDSGPRLRLGATIGRMPARAILRLWPTFVAAPVHGYLLHNLLAGTVETHVSLDFDAEALALTRAHKPPPDNAMKLDFSITNGTLVLVPGVPPLSGVEAVGKGTGRTTSIIFSRGAIEGTGGKRLSLLDATFLAPENEKKPAPATVQAHFTGGMDVVADILGREGMKPFGGMQIDASVIKGQIDAQLGLDLKLGKEAHPDDQVVRVNANIANLSIDHLIAKEKLDQGTMNVQVDRTGLRATGQGKLFGSPATLEMKKPPGGNTEATVGFMLDEAGRIRMGMTTGQGITGQIGVKVTAPFGVKDATQAQVELDLLKSGLDGLIPGLVKPAGKPAKATFTLDTTPHGATLDQFAFDTPAGAMVRGALEFDSAGAFRSARLSQLRLSPGDDMKVDADLGKDGLKLVVRAVSMDARPFLKGLFTDDGSKDITAAKDLDLDLRAPLVTGSNRQALAGVDLKVSRHGGSLRNFQLQARSGKAAIIGLMTRSRDGDAVVSLSTSDGGTFLAFLDLYKRMEGGKFALAARLNPDGVDGSFQVTDFIMRDEPALRRLVTEGVPQRDSQGAIKIDTGAAVFSRMQATFDRTSGRINVRDGVLYGNQIGIKLDGDIDFGRDTVNMTGTFVPAYGVNNLFSQIPLFGPILGGGTHEGLFAVNFRISGQASTPQLTINPLSAIAPGFLRKIFGAGEVSPGQFPTPPPANQPLQLTPQPR